MHHFWTHLFTENLNPAVNCRAVQETFLDKQALQRPDPECWVGGNMGMQVLLKLDDALGIPWYRHVAPLLPLNPASHAFF